MTLAKDISLGCIADDYTGASYLANTLTRQGLRTVQTIGVPSDDLKLPEVDGSFSIQGMEPTFSPQPEFAAFVGAELKKYAVLIKESGAAEN